MSNSNTPDKHPQPSRAQGCKDALRRKEEGCAFFSCALLEQTFSVEMITSIRLSCYITKKLLFLKILSLSLKRRSFPWQLPPETPIPGVSSPSPGSPGQSCPRTDVAVPTGQRCTHHWLITQSAGNWSLGYFLQQPDNRRKANRALCCYQPPLWHEISVR